MTRRKPVHHDEAHIVRRRGVLLARITETGNQEHSRLFLFAFLFFFVFIFFWALLFFALVFFFFAVFVKLFFEGFKRLKNSVIELIAVLYAAVQLV